MVRTLVMPRPLPRARMPPRLLLPLLLVYDIGRELSPPAVGIRRGLIRMGSRRIELVAWQVLIRCGRYTDDQNRLVQRVLRTQDYYQILQIDKNDGSNDVDAKVKKA